MIYPDQIGEAEKEWRRGRYLHQNYLARQNDEPDKAAEHLWGAINKLLSAHRRLKEGTGITSHGAVMEYLEKYVEGQPELDIEHVDSVEDLHGQYYHGYWREERLRREFDRTERIYDVLAHELTEIFEERTEADRNGTTEPGELPNGA